MDKHPSLAKAHRDKWYVLVLTLVALAVLLVSLWLPTLKLTKVLIFHDTYSIWRGIVELWKSDHYLLAALIFFFSMMFPLVKLAAMLVIWLRPMNRAVRNWWLHWLGLLGKWSMLDVFVVAVLIVLIKAGDLADATAGVGIYLFAAAILLSMVAANRIESLAELTDKPGT